MRFLLSLAILLGLAGGGAAYYVKYVHTEGVYDYRTAKIERGDMLPTIGATGTVEPEEVVDVGAQVAGLIKELKVDYGSAVEEGTVLARIDDTKYKAQFDSAEAAVYRAKADVGQMRAKLAQAQADLKRAAKLMETNAIARADYDAAVANFEVAKANVDVDEAAIRQAEATRQLASTDMGYTVIQSPVKGVIVDRRVNVGQTVVASLNAPSLFLLAKDLTRMQVWASVNEADIGRIRKGVKARFTVDAHPNENFYGEVAQIRFNANMNQNVVTYTVVVSADNSSMKLLPYLTANVQFEIEEHLGVLRVPNAALRWKPKPQQIAPDIREETLADMKPRNKDKDKPDRDANTVKATSGTQSSALVTKDAVVTRNSVPSTQPSGGTATSLSPDGWKARANKPPAATNPSGKPAAVGTASIAKPAIGPAKGEVLSEAARPKERYDRGRVWIRDGNFVRPLDIKIIATDGTLTEIRGRDLQEDMEVVLGENVASDADADATNPFAPKFFKGGSKR